MKIRTNGHRARRIAAIAAVCLCVLVVRGAAAGYFLTRSLTLHVMPDLSAVPTPTVTPESTPSPTPEPTPTETPAPTAQHGDGLVFNQGFTFVSANWNPSFWGDFTSGTMTVDNVNHTMDFNLVFTLPESYSADYLSWNSGWFYGFTLRLSAANHYDGSISLSGNSAIGKGDGMAQLQNVNLAAGAASDDVLLYFYGTTWPAPKYSEDGNVIVMKIRESYTYVGVNLSGPPWYDRFKYTQAATITLILPATIMFGTMSTEGAALELEATETMEPSETPNATPEPTETPAIAPMDTATVTPTATPAASPTATIAVTETLTPPTTAAPTETPSTAPEPSETAAPPVTPEAMETALPMDTQQPTAVPATTVTPTAAPADTATAAPAESVTSTPTAVATPTPSMAPTPSPTPMITASPTPTPSPTPTSTQTPAETSTSEPQAAEPEIPVTTPG